MSIKGLDKYLDPPDEPEIPLCEACGHEMAEEDKWDAGFYCNNPLCPDLFSGLMKEMAEKIVEQEVTIDELQSTIRRLKRKIEQDW